MHVPQAVSQLVAALAEVDPPNTTKTPTSRTKANFAMIFMRLSLMGQKDSLCPG
jgi:hypothetical protein